MDISWVFRFLPVGKVKFIEKAPWGVLTLNHELFSLVICKKSFKSLVSWGISSLVVSNSYLKCPLHHYIEWNYYFLMEGIRMIIAVVFFFGSQDVHSAVQKLRGILWFRIMVLSSSLFHLFLSYCRLGVCHLPSNGHLCAVSRCNVLRRSLFRCFFATSLIHWT